MLAALIALTSLAALCGMVAGYVSVRYRVDDDPLPARVDALLPQTQCGRCGFDGCRPYAEAIARGDAGIDRCPPGGEATIHALAGLLDREPVPLDPTCGDEGPEAAAVIDEANCIGCTICIRACPVDAIVGAAKQMHTVIEAECTGCGLCVEPCPVDCIDMVPLPATVEYWRWPPPAAVTGGH